MCVTMRKCLTPKQEQDAKMWRDEKNRSVQKFEKSFA